MTCAHRIAQRPNPLTFSSFRSLSRSPAAQIPPPSPRTLLHGGLEGAGKHRQPGHLLADLVRFSWKARVNILAEDRLAVFLEASTASTLVSSAEKQAIVSGFS